MVKEEKENVIEDELKFIFSFVFIKNYFFYSNFFYLKYFKILKIIILFYNIKYIIYLNKHKTLILHMLVTKI